MEQEQKENQRSIRIGAERVLKLAVEYEKLGYLVVSNPATHSGVDLMIISAPDGKIRKVIEVTNYKNGQWQMDSQRFDRYIASLIYFDTIDGIEKELVVTSLDNLTASQLVELKKSGIHVTVRPIQDLPSEEDNQ